MNITRDYYLYSIQNFEMLPFSNDKVLLKEKGPLSLSERISYVNTNFKSDKETVSATLSKEFTPNNSSEYTYKVINLINLSTWHLLKNRSDSQTFIVALKKMKNFLNSNNFPFFY